MLQGATQAAKGAPDTPERLTTARHGIGHDLKPYGAYNGA